MNITNLFNNSFGRSLNDQSYDSSGLLEHLNNLIRNNPGVIVPGSTDFNGEVLSYAVYRELLKLNKPIEFVLVISTVIKHAMAFMSNSSWNQDQLMDLKFLIARNSVCVLQQDMRENAVALLDSRTLYNLSGKLLWFYENQQVYGNQLKAFYAIEMMSTLCFFHDFLHGSDLTMSLTSIRPGQDEMAVLEEGCSKYCAK